MKKESDVIYRLYLTLQSSLGCMMIRYKTEMVMTSWLYMAIESLMWTFHRQVAILSFSFYPLIFIYLSSVDLWWSTCKFVHALLYTYQPAWDMAWAEAFPRLQHINTSWTRVCKHLQRRRFTWHAEVNFIMRVEHVPIMIWPSTQG